MTEIRILLPEEYAQTWNRKRGGLKEKIDEDKLRSVGAKNADLWAHGSIYPRDPITGKFPDFNSITGLVKFVCEGRNGLLGYCENMWKYIGQLCSIIQVNVQAIEAQKREFESSLSEKGSLLAQVATLKRNLMQAQNENTFKDFIIKQSEREKFQVENLRKRAESTVKCLEARLKRLKKTCMGFRERKKSMKPIEVLAPKGGAARRRVYAVRQVLNSKKKSGVVRRNVGNFLVNMVSRDEILDLLNVPCNAALKKDILDMVIKEVASNMDADEVQATCDSIGLSRQGYRSLFKPFQAALRTLGTKKVIIPRPYAVETSRRKRNARVDEVLGGMHSIQSGAPLLGTRSKNNKSETVGLSEKNNVWFDLESVLKLMVAFYNMQSSQVQQLEVCIKLDEMELTSKTKFERVSIVLMNFALGSSYQMQLELPKSKRDPEWFSVQSEDHTWWLGMFQVHKETFAILKWVFDQTELPRIISLYESGELLHVNGHGSFKVRFHLACDLKTTKALYNIVSSPAQTTRNCMYCMYRMKEQRKGKSSSILCCNQDAGPDRHLIDKDFEPILPIPLQRVHVCTLHAMVRIIEKMIHNSCMFVWNIKGEQARKEGIARIEEVLSTAGLPGGCVKLEKDLKRSGKSSIPSKVSLGGDKARHFLKNMDPKRKGTFEFGKRLVEAERDRTEGANSVVRKLDAWNAFSNLNILLQKHTYTDEDKEEFKLLVSRFAEAYIKAWGESEVTHYIHILYAHGPWFAKEYGSLAVWNTQGMEKSHKQAKMAFHRATQRGGSSLMSKPLNQLGIWFYRKLLARHEQNIRRRASPCLDNALREAAVKRKRESWEKSTARETQRQWRSQRVRIGKKYVMA